MSEKLLFRWSRDQCSAKREKWLHFSVGLGFGIGLGLGYDSGYWFTNTKSLAKEFSKILIFEYFGHLKTGFSVFFDADSESPRMT